MTRLFFGGSLLAAAITICSTPATAGHTDRADYHAPIGVMRDHVHNKGEVMLSYRYGFMHMDGLRDGTSNVSSAQALTTFMAVPEEMDMRMHMVGGMVGITDQFTLSTMIGFKDLEMDMLNRMGGRPVMESDGVTDWQVSGSYKMYETKHSHLLLNLGVSLPTGSIDETNAMGAQLPYAMQTGSGTYDFTPGVSYSQFHHGWSWGGQLNAIVRTGTNDNDYRLGNNYQATAWVAKPLGDAWSVSFRLDGQHWDNIHGADPQLMQMMSPNNRPDLRGGTRVDALAGVNFIVPSGSLKGNRLALEFGRDIYQDLDGPQLETDYRVMLGWQYAFTAF